MSIYELMKNALEKSVKGRERKNKNSFIAFLLEKKYGAELQTGITTRDIENILTDGYSYDRAWRQVLQYEPHLRGTDYNEKVQLTQEKMIELGYSPNHLNDTKLLKSIAGSNIEVKL